MRKMSKILLMLVLVLMLVFSYTSISNAATEADYTGYEELSEELSDGSENKTQEETKTEEPETPKATEENKKDVANKSTEPHKQAGNFEVTIIMTSSIIKHYCHYIKYAQKILSRKEIRNLRSSGLR